MKLIMLLLSIFVYADVSGARVLSERIIRNRNTFCNWYIKTLEKYSAEEFSKLQKAFRNESEYTAALWAFVAGIQTVPACYNRKLIACLKSKCADPHEAVSSSTKLPTKNILNHEDSSTIELRAGDTLEDFMMILNTLYESSDYESSDPNHRKEKCRLQLIQSLLFSPCSADRRSPRVKRLP